MTEHPWQEGNVCDEPLDSLAAANLLKKGTITGTFTSNDGCYKAPEVYATLYTPTPKGETIAAKLD